MGIAAPLLLLFLLLCLVSIGMAQEANVTGRVIDRAHGDSLPGANVTDEGTTAGAVTGEDGRFVLRGLAPGLHRLKVSLLGYAGAETTLTLAAGEAVVLEFALEESHAEMEEVVVTGTRTVRSIADVPVRVELIPEEEVEEKLLMTPANVAMLLNESTGMRVQTTSAASNTANLRIQGLSGRFTQLLTDGVPNFGGMSSGFSVTQIPPLNLRQVEVIKGAASSLYGADAISGVVNFITKTPPEEGSNLSALLNATTAGGLDGAFYRGQNLGEGWGYTLLASGNIQEYHDADNDGFADIAKYERFSASPQFFFEPGEDAKIRAGVGYLTEQRDGGWTGGPWPASGPPPYKETIASRRWDASAQADFRLDEGRSVAVKLAGARLGRDATYGPDPFSGTQLFGYADAQFVQPFCEGNTILAGAAFSFEEFDDRTPAVPESRSYVLRTPGLFGQVEAKFSPTWSALAGARADFQDRYGTFVTPRLSIKYAPTPALTLRLGGGGGFKSPSIFVEEAEEIGFRNVRPIGGASVEKAASGTFDVSWSALAGGGVTLSANAALYVSRIEGMLVTDEDSLVSGGAVTFRNATGPTVSRGGEASARVGYGDFKLYLGYTYVYASEEDRGLVRESALNPRHSAGAVLFYESHESGLKAGFESYWTGVQRLERNPYRDVSPEYFILGVVAEKAFGPIRVFVNFENLTDTRQTRWDPVVAGGYDEASYRPVPVYAPLEGRVVNGGLRLVL